MHHGIEVALSFPLCSLVKHQDQLKLNYIAEQKPLPTMNGLSRSGHCIFGSSSNCSSPIRFLPLGAVVYLVPELCAYYPLDAKAYQTRKQVPLLLWGLHALLTAHELQQKLASLATTDVIGYF